jgi:hypothetical protein
MNIPVAAAARQTEIHSETIQNPSEVIQKLSLTKALVARNARAAAALCSVRVRRIFLMCLVVRWLLLYLRGLLVELLYHIDQGHVLIDLLEVGSLNANILKQKKKLGAEGAQKEL